MLIRNLSELRAALRPNSCLLGLDYGSVVIGVAISDPGLRIASPIGAITRKKFPDDAAALATLMKDRNIGSIVIGLPKNMDGSEGASAQAARAFIRNLEKFPPPRGEGQGGGGAAKSPIDFKDLPVLFWDERLSTAAVERFLIEGDMTRKRRDQVIDKAAAAYILQGALDALNSPVSLNRYE